MKPKTNHANRIWEIDFLRGVAIILMLGGHFLMDFQIFFGFILIDFMQGWGSLLRQLFNIFIFVAGISSALSRSNLKRGLRLLGIAMLITLGSYLLVPSRTIIVGILHVLALCMIIWPLMNRLNWKWLAGLGVISIGLGIWFAYILLPPEMPYKLLVPIGLQYRGFTTLDYFPIFPYIGVFLIGGAVGKTVYAARKSIFKFDPGPNFINTFGRHTLAIYLLHQAVFLPFFMILAKIFDWHFIFDVPQFLKFLFN
jgi:uncharacterized membrane protein